MRWKSGPRETAEGRVKDIHRKTRRKYSAEEKIRIVLEGLCREYSIAEWCRREGVAQGLYYSWSKEFLEAGTGRRWLSGNTERQATSSEVTDLRREMRDLKEVVADLTLENRLLKKRDRGWGTARNEVSRIREARDHLAGRAVPPAGETYAGEDRRVATDLLQVVRSLPALRRDRPGRQKRRIRPRLEPRSERCAQAGDRSCARGARTQPAGDSPSVPVYHMNRTSILETESYQLNTSFENVQWY